MNIDLGRLPMLWHENEAGDKYVPPEGEEMSDPPPGFVYQHFTNPLELRHTIHRVVQPDEVAACQHLTKDLRKTGGWIDGVEGRECTACQGSQTKKLEEPWPAEWDAHGARAVFTGTKSWNEALVLAMASRPWWRWWRKVYKLSEAILIVATACERCLNSLADEYGLDWGYKGHSEEWLRCGTSCRLCDDDPAGRGPSNGDQDQEPQAETTEAPEGSNAA